VITDVTDIANKTAALSEDGVTEVKVTLTLVSLGGTSPVADSDSQEGLLVNFRATGTKYPAEVWIPALIDTLTVNGKIDLSNTDLVDWVAAYTVHAHVFGANKYGQVITLLRDAAESFRKLKRLATSKSRSIA